MTQNSTAGILVIGIVIGVWLSQRRQTHLAFRGLLLVSSGLAVWEVVLTGSRGGLIALLGGILAILFTSTGGRGISITRLIVAGLFVAFIAYGIGSDQTMTRRIGASIERGDTAGRARIYSAAMDMVAERPLLGWGVYSNFYELGHRASPPFVDAHNTALLVFTRVGLIGGIPFFLGVGLCGVAAYKARRGALSVVFPLFVSVVLINMGISWERTKLTWIVLALSVAASRAAADFEKRRSALGAAS